MCKKKILFTICSMALICATSIAGTLAFLTNKTDDPVVNTFTAAGGGKLIESTADGGSFVLAEHAAIADDLGNYTLGTNTVTANNYAVLPGVDLPKDPFITITGKTSAPAYLYVEVVDGISDNDALSFEIDASWTELNGVVGPQGGKVYVYSNDGAPVIVTDATNLDSLNIIKDKTVKVANNEIVIADEGINLKFYGYLAQASAGTSAESVYTTCFSN